MSTSYQYSLENDFKTSHAIGIIRFINDVRTNNLITTGLIGIGVNGDIVTITFESALSSAEKSALDNVVANHIPGNPHFDSDAIIRDIKCSETNGGTFTHGCWKTRDLNAIEGDNVDLWITLANNSFILVKGSYKLTGVTSSYSVDNNQTRIFNNTTNNTEFYGINTVSGMTTQSLSYIEGNIKVLNDKSSYTLEHICKTTKHHDGFGVASCLGTPEIYTIIHITKIS